MALSYVGGASATGTGATYNVSLTALTGGSNSSPSVGDLVIVATNVTGTTDVTFTAPTGYLKVADLYGNDTRDANLGIFYKYLTAADTSVTVTGSNNAANGGATVVQVWRGAESEPFIYTSYLPVTITGTNASNADCPSITPPADAVGSVTLAIGAGTGATTQTAPAVLAGFTNLVSVNGDGSTMDGYVAICSKAWTSGAVNPEAYASGATSTSDAWCAATLQLNPAVTKIGTLQQTFNSGSAPSGWNNYAGATGTVAYDGRVLEVKAPALSDSSTVTPDGLAAAGPYWDLTESAAYVKFVSPPTGQSSGDISAVFLLTTQELGVCQFRWIWNPPSSLAFQWAFGNVFTTLFITSSYDPAVHSWLKISETGGTVTGWTAPDDGLGNPGTWVSRGTVTRATAGFPFTRLEIDLSLFNNVGALTAGAKFDGFNTFATQTHSATGAIVGPGAVINGDDTRGWFDEAALYGNWLDSDYAFDVGVQWRGAVANRIASTGVQGTLASTESTADTFASTGGVLVQGDLIVTESGSDTFAGAGVVKVQGDLAATEPSVDTIASTGNVYWQGSMAATEAAVDTLASTGTVLVQGTLVATDVTDTFASTGTVLVQGDLIASEAEDTTSITGTVLVQGSLAVTEGSDTVALAGAVLVQGSLSVTESATDSVSSTGSVLVQGSLAVTDAIDTFASSGTVLVQGSLSATEGSVDTFAATGAPSYVGTLAATETILDTFAATGTTGHTGTLAATETGADTFAADGILETPGSMQAVETGVDTFVSNGVVLVQGDLNALEPAEDTCISDGTVLVQGDCDTQEDTEDAFAASGTVVNYGVLDATEDADTVTSTGAVRIQTSIALVETGLDTFLADGKNPVAGDLAATEGATADTFASIGQIIVTGTLAVTETVTADSFAGSGAVRVQGVVGAVETLSDTAAFVGAVLVQGSLAVTESASDTFAAIGSRVSQGALAVTETAVADTFAATGAIIVSGTLAAIEVGGDVALFSLSVLVRGPLATFEDSADDTFEGSGVVLISGDLAAVEIELDKFFATTHRDQTYPLKGIYQAYPNVSRQEYPLE